MLSILLPGELEERLERLAVRTGRSTTFHVHEALVQYLDDLEDFYVAEERLEEFRKSGREGIPLEELMRRYIREAIDDPSDDIDEDAVFDRIERRHAERMRREGKD
ncbi:MULTISPECIES: type II toxin-antitoxin system RelB family antitoxin [unclassified Rhizobium]|uniref:type II toxin-antitoxin system RelB family antitoxin n=1 Tax=unclassified Rhizobium TaxID=2613769 RepID=UPI001FD865E1|nr:MULTISPECIES: hypothetical protein [unclassified Rhizobium]